MSANFRVTATRLSDKSQIALQNLKSLRLLATLDSPAQSLSANFAPNGFPGDLGGVKVWCGERLLFEGNIDCQKSAVSKAGVLLTLDARSAGALLLDNQAQPCVLLGVQLATIFNRFIAPYGFSLYNPNRASFLPAYTIRAGQSEWDALVGFTRRVYGVTPYVRGMQIMLERPYSSQPLVIGNAGGALPYTSLSHIRTPYNIVSQVILRDENGNYSASVANSAAAYTNTRRKRYAVPPGEYANRLAQNANQRVRRSMLESEQVVAILPGIVEAQLGQDARVKDKYLTQNNLMVRAREIIADENGVRTKLTLISSVYYD